MKIISILENDENKEELFLNILCNETIAEEDILIESCILREVGGVNTRLKEKQNYELLLRLADTYSFTMKECVGTEVVSDSYRVLKHTNVVSEWESIRTDCYIVAKYRERLLQIQMFDAVVESIIVQAASCAMQEQAIAQLENMLRYSKDYYEIDDATKPILIYKGDEVCHNILTVFAERFGDALERYGCPVEYFDSRVEDVHTLTKYIGLHYRAIVGFQSYFFSIKMSDNETYLHDLIHGPKYNAIFDHPVWMKSHLSGNIRDLCVLTHDRNYMEFVKTYYQKQAYFLPPAGIVDDCKMTEKKYEISFVGTYGNYWYEVLLIHAMERKNRFIANRFLLEMRKHPDLTSEEALHRVLKYYGIECSHEMFLEELHALRRVVYCVMHYYRHQVLKSLLEAGLQVDVFGESWSTCPLRAYSGMICHPNVSPEESLEIFVQSKFSLNIMSWHKDGFTERMANIMLAGAVLITDWTTCLDEMFEPNTDMLAFRLEELDDLPDRIYRFLMHDEERKQIALNGQKKALQYHTWDNRAKTFMEEIIMR